MLMDYNSPTGYPDPPDEPKQAEIQCMNCTEFYYEHESDAEEPYDFCSVLCEHLYYNHED